MHQYPRPLIALYGTTAVFLLYCKACRLEARIIYPHLAPLIVQGLDKRRSAADFGKLYQHVLAFNPPTHKDYLISVIYG